MPNELADLMTRSTADLRNVDGPARIVERVRRKTRRRNYALAVVAIAVAGTATFVPLAISSGSSSSGVNQVVPAAPPPTTQAPDPLTSPDGPANASRMLSRAYPVDTVTAGGQTRTLLLYWADADLTPSRPGHNLQANSLCLARWTPGTTLASAAPDQCSGPYSVNLAQAHDTRGVLISWEDGSFGAAIPNKQLIVFNKQVARVQLLLGLKSDLPATASPDGGHPPVRKTLEATLLGADQANAPFLIALAPRPPQGYTWVGEKAWDADGKVLLSELSGWYCGPDGKGNNLPCPS